MTVVPGTGLEPDPEPRLTCGVSLACENRPTSARPGPDHPGWAHVGAPAGAPTGAYPEAERRPGSVLPGLPPAPMTACGAWIGAAFTMARQRSETKSHTRSVRAFQWPISATHSRRRRHATSHLPRPTTTWNRASSRPARGAADRSRACVQRQQDLAVSLFR